MAVSPGPWDDYASPAQPTQAPPVQPASTSVPSNDGPWSDFTPPPVAQDQSNAQPAPGMVPRDEIDARIQSMLADPSKRASDFADYYKSLGATMRPEDAKTYATRDAYNDAHKGQTMQVGVYDPTIDSKVPAPVDNRPESFEAGMIDGGHKVISNIAGGVGAIGNLVGLKNDWGQEVQDYYDKGAAIQPYKGSAGGKLTGELLATLPTVAIGGPVTEGAEALGLAPWLARTAGYAGEGAAQGGLTTDKHTWGGVAHDVLVGAGEGAALGNVAHSILGRAAVPTASAQAGRRVLNTLDDLGIPDAARPGLVGGSIARGIDTVADNGLISGIPLDAAKGRLTQGAHDVLQDIASGVSGSTPRSLSDVSNDVIDHADGLGNYADRSQQEVDAQFARARSLAPDARISYPQTNQTIKDIIGELRQSPDPDYDQIAKLNAMLDRRSAPVSTTQPYFLGRLFGETPVTTVGETPDFAIDGARQARSSLNKPYDSTDGLDRSIAKRLRPAMTADIDAGLRVQGHHDAADAFRQADGMFKARMDNIDNVVQPVLANRGQGQLASYLTGLAAKNPGQLNRALDLVSPDLAGEVRGSLLHNLGRPARTTADNFDDPGFDLRKFGADYSDANLHPTFKKTLPADAQDRLNKLAELAVAQRKPNPKIEKLAQVVVNGLPATGGLIAGGPVGAALGLAGDAAGQLPLGFAASSPWLARQLVAAGEARPIMHGAGYLAQLAQHTAPVISTESGRQP